MEKEERMIRVQFRGNLPCLFIVLHGLMVVGPARGLLALRPGAGHG